MQGSTDPLNEYYSGSTIQGATLVDLVQMEAVGDHVQTEAVGDHVSLSSYAYSSIAASLLANMNLLQAALPLVSRIALTDSGTPTVTQTATQYAADAAVLAKVSTPFALTVNGTTGSDTLERDSIELDRITLRSCSLAGIIRSNDSI